MEYLTTQEIADLYGVSPDTIRRLIDSGEIASIRTKDHGWRRITKQAVVDYAAKRGIVLDWSKVKA